MSLLLLLKKTSVVVVEELGPCGSRPRRNAVVVVEVPDGGGEVRGGVAAHVFRRVLVPARGGVAARVFRGVLVPALVRRFRVLKHERSSVCRRASLHMDILRSELVELVLQ